MVELNGLDIIMKGVVTLWTGHQFTLMPKNKLQNVIVEQFLS